MLKASTRPRGSYKPRNECGGRRTVGVVYRLSAIKNIGNRERSPRTSSPDVIARPRQAPEVQERPAGRRCPMTRNKWDPVLPHSRSRPPWGCARRQPARHRTRLDERVCETRPCVAVGPPVTSEGAPSSRSNSGIPERINVASCRYQISNKENSSRFAIVMACEAPSGYPDVDAPFQVIDAFTRQVDPAIVDRDECPVRITYEPFGKRRFDGGVGRRQRTYGVADAACLVMSEKLGLAGEGSYRDAERDLPRFGRRERSVAAGAFASDNPFVA